MSSGAGAEDFMAGVFEDAMRKPPLHAAAKYRLAGLRLLAALCRELQEAQGNKPFYLSCRDGARLLGASFKQAARWLLRLEGDGVIECVRRGSQGNGLASEYRYLGD